MTNSPQIILAIESAIGGGSISLLSDGSEIAHWVGKSDVSKAEELLVNIDSLLKENNIHRKEIDMIAVSAGPGSFTGIRIGIATALGLKNGLGITMSSQSALKAMTYLQTEGKITAAIPMGRNAVCLQSFQKNAEHIDTLDEPHTMQEDTFLSLPQNDAATSYILHAALYEKAVQSVNIKDFGSNIAFVIGVLCRSESGIVTEPLFISKSF